MAIKHGLGRGLNALISEAPTAVQTPAPEAGGILRVSLGEIHVNPLQPRRQFSPEALQELVSSVKERGVLQPLLVRRKGAGYELIAGERRYRAAREAGLPDVPVILMDVADGESLELALVENLQREDLNPMEEAEGYRVLGEKFDLTQEQIATRVGKARASVANALRLLGLPLEIREAVTAGRLSVGHAKALLALEIEEEQKLLARRAIQEGLSVRSLERIIERATKGPRRKARVSQEDIPSDHLSYLTDRLYRHFGTSVRLVPCRTLPNGKKVKGAVEIDFYSSQDLDRILQLFGIEDLQ